MMHWRSPWYCQGNMAATAASARPSAWQLFLSYIFVIADIFQWFSILFDYFIFLFYYSYFTVCFYFIILMLAYDTFGSFMLHRTVFAMFLSCGFVSINYSASFLNVSFPLIFCLLSLLLLFTLVHSSIRSQFVSFLTALLRFSAYIFSSNFSLGLWLNASK